MVDCLGSGVFSACIGFVTDNTGLIAAFVPLGSCFLCLAAMYYNKYKIEKGILL